MGVNVNTDGLHECVSEIKKCQRGIDIVISNMKKCKFPIDNYYIGPASALGPTLKVIINNLDFIQESLKKNELRIEKKAQDFEKTEQNNKEITAVLLGAIQTIDTSYIGSTITSSQLPLEEVEGNSIQNDSQNTVPQPPTEVEIEESKQETEQEKVPDTQVEEVIVLIFGKDIDIPDSVKEIVTKAILEINKTEILDGLDEKYANEIRSEIIEDYLEGKLELEGITSEQIQEYINSEPSIKILLETAKALKSFGTLIESGVITKEQIKTIIEENLVIQSDEEFERMYIENGGVEAETKNVKSFYNPETGKMYVRDTVDSKVITISIITIMGDIMIYDEETGEVLYNNTQGNLDKEPDVNIPDQNINTSTTPTEDLDEEPETNLSGEVTDTSTSNNEVIEDKDITVEKPEEGKNTNDSTANVEDISSNEDINIESENRKETSTIKTNLGDKQKK